MARGFAAAVLAGALLGATVGGWGVSLLLGSSAGQGRPGRTGTPAAASLPRSPLGSEQPTSETSAVARPGHGGSDAASAGGHAAGSRVGPKGRPAGLLDASVGQRLAGHDDEFLAVHGTAACPQWPQRRGADRRKVTITVVGDVSFARDIKDHARERHGGKYDYVFEHVRGAFASSDLAIVNLESPLLAPGDAATPVDPRYITLFGDAQGATALRDAGVKLAFLANNHVADAGLAGLKSTLDALRANGVSAAGLNPGKEQDLRGGDALAVLQVAGCKVAVFSYCALPACAARTQANGWGPAVLDDAAKKRIAATRSRVDVIVVAVHWGSEYTTAVERSRRDTATALAALGADVVVGHHAHVPQGHARVGGSFVAYGLGNFVFDSHACRHPKTGELSNATMATSPACRRMHPAQRERMARLIRKTRVYRVEVEAGAGVTSAEYLPCDIAAEPGPVAYRPVPTRPGGWVPVCTDADAHCLECS